MAIVNNGTRVLLANDYLPNGYTRPTITTVAGPELWVNRTSFTILKSAVENANAVTAFTALVSEVNTAAGALVTLYFNAAEDIEFYTDFVTLDENQDPEDEETAYTTAAESFTCGVVIKVQTVEIT